jgi:hypothetical protein
LIPTGEKLGRKRPSGELDEVGELGEVPFEVLVDVGELDEVVELEEMPAEELDEVSPEELDEVGELDEVVELDEVPAEELDEVVSIVTEPSLLHVNLLSPSSAALLKRSNTPLHPSEPSE